MNQKGLAQILLLGFIAAALIAGLSFGYVKLVKYNNECNCPEKCCEFRFGKCPKGCLERCMPSGALTADCSGPGSCYCNPNKNESENLNLNTNFAVNTNTAEEAADCSEGWSTYTSSNYGYAVKYPSAATLEFLEESSYSLSPAEVAAGVTFAEKFTEYGPDLCVTIRLSEAAYAIIIAPANNEAGILCQRSGVGVIIEQVSRSDTFTVEGSSYAGTGNIYISEDPNTGAAGTTLMYHNETNYVTLGDGTVIEYGSTPDENTLYTDYELQRETLICLIESYISN